MTRTEFEGLLCDATRRTIEFARRFVSNSLPDEVEYHVLLNQSCDLDVAEGDLTFPEDEGVTLSGLTADEVVRGLYREGRCPMWIDISVEAVAGARTCVELRCAGRYTANDASMHYAHRGTGPFSVKGPSLPPDYVENTKFALPSATRDAG